MRNRHYVGAPSLLRWLLGTGYMSPPLFGRLDSGIDIS